MLHCYQSIKDGCGKEHKSQRWSEARRKGTSKKDTLDRDCSFDDHALLQVTRNRNAGINSRIQDGGTQPKPKQRYRATKQSRNQFKTQTTSAARGRSPSQRWRWQSRAEGSWWLIHNRQGLQLKAQGCLYGQLGAFRE